MLLSIHPCVLLFGEGFKALEHDRRYHYLRPWWRTFVCVAPFRSDRLLVNYTKLLIYSQVDLTWRAWVANCIPLVTPKLSQLQLPQRLLEVGWKQAIYARGELGNGPAVAIVGARAATAAAMQHAYALARHLALRGIAVVSGGALGVDGAAHRGALAGGGATTVILGAGVDIAYPDRHKDLFDEVARAGGVLASLVPDGTPPTRYSFVRRNPLIAALADMVVVVEAQLRSGSLTTAKAAKAYGRVVAAWPGSPGCDRLLDEGAAIVESEADVDRALAGMPRRVVPRGRRDAVLTPEMSLVRAAVAAGFSEVDAIVDRTGLSVPSVLRALARLS